MKRNKISKATCYKLEIIMDTRPGFWQQIEGKEEVCERIWTCAEKEINSEEFKKKFISPVHRGPKLLAPGSEKGQRKSIA